VRHRPEWKQCSCRMSSVSLSAMNTISAAGFSGTVRGRRALPGFTLERLLYRAGQVVPAHHHAAPAVILLASGYCMLCNDVRRDLRCAPGAAIVHPAGELHSYRYEADCDSQMLAITFPAQSCDRFRAPLNLNLPRVTHDPEIAPLTLRLRRRVEQPHTSALSLEAAVFELLGQLCGPSEEASATPSLARVRDLLHDRFKEPLSLAEIARTADLSLIQLARHFRRRFGHSPAAYIRNLRLAYACERLASSSVPIVDLAQELGFFDQSHFCHSFRKHFGLSPTAYRQQHRRH
jgi:AraC family transcriptional regulator